MHFENFSFKLHTYGKDGESQNAAPGRIKSPLISHHQMIEHINGSSYDDETKILLIEEVKKQPVHSMGQFLKNIHRIVARINKQKRKQ